MKTLTFFPVLTAAVAGSLFLACGSPDRLFVEEDSGSPLRDGSSGSDATPDAAVVDQQSDSKVDGDSAVFVDAPPPETSTDTRLDLGNDARVDTSVDGGAPDTVTSDVAVDITANDITANDSAISDTSPDKDGIIDSGGVLDIYADILDCSGTSSPRITPAGSVGICPGKSVTLTSSAATSYAWSTSATTQAIDVNMAGSYTVTTTDARGCRATSSPTAVTAHPAPTTPTISAGGPTRFCNGGSVVLTASLASSYAWSTGATTQSIVVIDSGSYTVTTTDANGCSATSAATAVTEVLATTGSRSYTFAGAADTFVVPECVTTLVVDAFGAEGGTSNAGGLGGYGSEIQAYLNVTPGAALQIRVGGAGALCSVDSTGGFNGGGVANCAGNPGGMGVVLYSATGGGATDLRVSPFGLDDRVIVAGGGGGAGYNCHSTEDSGGIGGGFIGGKFPTMCNEPDSAGGGGTQASGGIGGTYSGYGYAGYGGYGMGGSGVSSGGSMAYQGGGGGGGYFGGGGGCWAGGGGGSDYLRTTVASVLAHNPGAKAGHGTLILSW